MPTATFSSQSDGMIESLDPTYAGARTPFTPVEAVQATLRAGQVLSGGGDFTLSEAFLSFDTSSLPNDAEVDSAVLRLYLPVQQAFTADFTVEVYVVAWTSPLDPKQNAATLSSIPMQLWYANDDPFSTGITGFADDAGAEIHDVGALGHTDAAIAAVTMSSIMDFLTDLEN